METHRKDLHIPVKNMDIINRITGNSTKYINDLIEVDLKNIRIERVEGGVRVMYYGKCIDSAQCSTPEEAIIASEMFEKEYKL